jgi:hypothetical protein
MNLLPKKIISLNQNDAVRVISCGSFARVEQDTADKFVYCRDYFHLRDSETPNQLLFLHRNNKTEAIADFIYQIEDVLEVKEKTQFSPTQRSNILWIGVSPWWQTVMRSSLLTILLRASQNYNQRSGLEKALFGIDLTRYSEYSVRRFMNGYTTYTGDLGEWYRQFGTNRVFDCVMPSNETIEQLLVKA